jgi:hypothetical protein
MKKFLQWCADNNYDDIYDANFVLKNIYFESGNEKVIKEYIRQVKKDALPEIKTEKV